MKEKYLFVILFVRTHLQYYIWLYYIWLCT